MLEAAPRRGKDAAARRAFGWGLLFVAAVYFFMANGLSLNLLEHSAHDSYTLQAMRWREGHIALAEDYDWLELAYYDGGIYVSFPPFPTVPMLLLTFLFGANTPSMLVNFCLFLGSYAAGYCMARRLKRPAPEAAFIAAFWVSGCNLLEVSLYGGVWNIAQGMSFFLTMLAAYGTVADTRAWRYASPICIACAVGCRPFQAVYVPFILLWLYRSVRRERMGRRMGYAFAHGALRRGACPDRRRLPAAITTFALTISSSSGTITCRSSWRRRTDSSRSLTWARTSRTSCACPTCCKIS